jgi:hypothetical protein
MKNLKINKLYFTSIIFLTLILFSGDLFPQGFPLPVPDSLRGKIDAERMGQHDFNRIRTRFFNYGMVGDYPADPINVDLTTFHSVEVPKGSGENYSDGITPFVLAKITQESGSESYIFETGYRERQGTSPITNKTMRFEPRPGYFQNDAVINKARSVAMSNDPRTWPDKWVDKLYDTDDPGWGSNWNGYFGKAPKLEMQESFVVFDDNYYDAWNYFPDSRDRTRRGLGLRVEQRGFQWNNPQAGNVIFFHYDITNESTTDYNDNILFGLYMDAGVGGSTKGVDPYPESDDDNAYFSREPGLNIVYTWDYYGNGVRGKTGYLGYSYLETPGNPLNFIDDDDDGITDEKRDGGPGVLLTNQDAIKNYVIANYNLAKFEAYYGKLENMPAYQRSYWWTGDEDLDWIAEFHDTGADGVFGTNDTGELDGIPTNGEPNFDKTDIDESDQIGLTGFKYNVINDPSGGGSTDNIIFFDDGRNWPKRLYNIFTTPDSSFEQEITRTNINLGFLFASGPFKLPADKTERFSLALAFGHDLRELKNNTKVVQKIYKANYQFAVPPPMPTLTAFAGDRSVTLSWDDAAERAYDPVTTTNDFEGYRIYRSTDPTFLDPQVITTGTGSGPIGNGKPIAQFDLINDIVGFSQVQVEGVGYFLGSDNGLTHTFVDTTVVNGQRYYYAVTAYDRGSDSLELYPSENAIAVTQTLRGGTILSKNTVEVVPNPHSVGYVPAKAENIVHSQGRGTGTVDVLVKNSNLVPNDHIFKIEFFNPTDSVKATSYSLIDETAGDTLFKTGTDFSGLGIGPVAKGVLPVITTSDSVFIDTVTTGFTSASATTIAFASRYAPSRPGNFRRNGYPDNIEIIFSDEIQDTSVAGFGTVLRSKPVKFKVIAKSSGGDKKLKFRFADFDNSGTINQHGDYIEILTYADAAPTTNISTWNIRMDTTGQYLRGAIVPPAGTDLFKLNLLVPFEKGDIFTFKTTEQKVDADKAKSDYNTKPYVVPNPYVGAASFEPQRFAVSGRGERKLEFRGLPANCTIRIYTVTGELVQTLYHEGNITEGFVPWDLRTKDNLEVAPGLYIFHVDANGVDPYIGKFAIIK